MANGRHTQPWLIEIPIEPKSEADREKLDVALAKLAADDPSFGVSRDEEAGYILLKGLGELHLGTKLDLLKRTHKLEVEIGAPQVAYREKITGTVTVDYTHKKLTGSSGQFARVAIIAEPMAPGEGFAFVNKTVGGAVPNEYIPGVEKGLESVVRSGILAGFPVVDLRVTLIGGAYHDLDSSARAFEIAARMALREALQKGAPVLLEPIMKVEVVTPQGHAGGVIDDLKARGGEIQGDDMRDTAHVITATAPLAGMFGYAAALRSMTRGSATFTMQFDHHAPVPLPPGPPFRPAAGVRA